jgi:hypothetical protein
MIDNFSIKAQNPQPMGVNKTPYCLILYPNGYTGASLMLPNKILTDHVEKGGLVYAGW